MKASDKYFRFVEWSGEDQAWIGYCPDLFPYGGICDSKDKVQAFATLCEIIDDDVESRIKNNEPLPEPQFGENVAALVEKSA
jgi:predicted RNase H-like HicB family nuclease